MRDIGERVQPSLTSGMYRRHAIGNDMKLSRNSQCPKRLFLTENLTTTTTQTTREDKLRAQLELVNKRIVTLKALYEQKLRAIERTLCLIPTTTTTTMTTKTTNKQAW